jgi:hypothetical protein
MPLTYEAVLEKDAETAFATYEAVLACDAETAFATYEAVDAIPVTFPMILPVTFNDPDIETDSNVLPVNTSYKSDTKLADINPPDVI